ncbi:MAG: aldose epimerase family protein [Tidjanibacter sp.]|nr:aldose epimerase family protein [Tidjanibacter sp.]
MDIEQQVMGYTPEDEAVVLYTMRNAAGCEVKLCNIGAAVVSVTVPDRKGNKADVVLGYATLLDYVADGPCMGKVPGRYANRIAKGRFTLDGKTYHLAINNGPNALHGGIKGYANRVWEGRIEVDRVVFALDTPDGDEGYPSAVYTEAVYDWNDHNELELKLVAKSNGATVINLTNHTYFNLAGEGSGSVLDHTLWLGASRYLPTDNTLIPLGEMAPVAATPMDFTTPKTLGRDIKTDFAALNYGKGYDNCYVIDCPSAEKMPMKVAAKLKDSVSGRTLTVSTDQPAVQIYTGNWLEGCPEGKNGHAYHDYDGVAIECQGMPDAPNHPNFPSQVLREGETYRRRICFAFGVE